jgi:beta-lactam-binding protein with PASTA domain
MPDIDLSGRRYLTAGALSATALALAACGSAPGPSSAQKAAVAGILGSSGNQRQAGSVPSVASPPAGAPAVSTTTITFTTTSTTEATVPQVVMPQLIGLHQRDLKAAAGGNFRYHSMNAECSNGTVPSESVVAAVQLYQPAGPATSGQMIPKGSVIGLTWSGCWPNGTTVPSELGQPWNSGNEAVRMAGLKVNCVSAAPYSPITNAGPVTVLSESPPAGSHVAGGSVVMLKTQVCQADVPKNSGNTGNSGN